MRPKNRGTIVVNDLLFEVPTTQLATFGAGGWSDGAGTRNRTADLLITNQSLYRLSYPGMQKTIRTRRIPVFLRTARRDGPNLRPRKTGR